jgi:transcriptional regulator with XRE-family HTH domain
VAKVRGAVVSLREFRQQRGLSQAAIAVLGGVSQREVSLVERGEVRPRPETIVKLAKAFGVGAERMAAILATPAADGSVREPESAGERP